MSAVLLPVATLWKREMVRFFRQPNRIMGAVGSPLLFWFLIGSGVGGTFQPAEANLSYSAFIFPGVLVMVLLFTAIFSTISIIEDRREGFLQSVLVAPVPRASVVLGKILGGASLAFVQALVLLALAPLAGVAFDPVRFAGAAGILAVLAVALTGLGFAIAWRMQSTQGFHAIMNLVLLPMWLLAGTLFPTEGAAAWMQAVMRVNPLTYGVQAVRLALAPESAGPGLALSLAITAAFTVAMIAAAAFAARGHTRGDLQ